MIAEMLAVAGLETAYKSLLNSCFSTFTGECRLDFKYFKGFIGKINKTPQNPQITDK